jgi:hypothetical protein
MVLPVVLASLALVGYFLTKPKKSDSDIYSVSGFFKDDKPKKETKSFDIKCDECKTKIGFTNRQEESVQGGKCAKCQDAIKKENSEIEKERKKLDEIIKKEKTDKVLFARKNSDGYIIAFRNNDNEEKIKIGMIDNSKVKPTYSMFNAFTKSANQKPYTKDEEMAVKEKVSQIIEAHNKVKTYRKDFRKTETNLKKEYKKLYAKVAKSKNSSRINGIKELRTFEKRAVRIVVQDEFRNKTNKLTDLKNTLSK